VSQGGLLATAVSHLLNSIAGEMLGGSTCLAVIHSLALHVAASIVHKIGHSVCDDFQRVTTVDNMHWCVTGFVFEVLEARVLFNRVLALGAFMFNSLLCSLGLAHYREAYDT
jgi:uncharacterized membrane protein YGL010W